MTETQIPTPTPRDTVIQRVAADTDPRQIAEIVERDGGVILTKFFSDDQVRRFNSEIDPYLDELDRRLGGQGRPVRRLSRREHQATDQCGDAFQDIPRGDDPG